MGPSRVRFLLCACLLTVGAIVSPLGSGLALAVPQASFDWAPNPPVAGQPVTLRSTSTPTGPPLPADPPIPMTITWDLPGMTGCDATPTADTCTINSPPVGTWPVTLTASDVTGSDSATEMITVVPANLAPPADFAALPGFPVTGQEVTFVALSDDPDGSTTEWAWDLDSDGAFDDGDTKLVTRSFATAGEKIVRLRVTDNEGATATESLTLVVRQPGTPPPPAASNPVTSAGGTVVGNTVATGPLPRLMSPFPVVTVGGSVRPTGTKIELLAVRAARGARVLVRCRGKACRMKKVSKVMGDKRLRVKRAQRLMPAGVALEVLVRRGDRIGKFTRLKFRDNKRPKRTDGCLWPGTSQMAPCPER
jgi:PKD repeat protein